MQTFGDYEKHDGLGLAELVRKKEVSPAELVETAIARIEAVNPAVNAVVHKMYAAAREAARAEHRGSFGGVPFLLKDLQAGLAGVPRTSGSRFYRSFCPEETDELVSRFLAAGVIVLGKTNTPELGILPTTEPELHGPTRNPWDPTRTAGGSSGGTAAAVASGMVPLGSGGDGGGSIRIPCSCCGLFGLKPSRGRTPTGPTQAEAWHGFAQEHVLTRSVRDSAAMLDATAGPFPGDADQLPRPQSPFLDEVGKKPGRLRIAYSAEPFLESTVHADCRTALEDAVTLLQELGHDCVEDRPPLDGHAFARAFLLMVGAHTWATIREDEEAVGRKATPRDFEVKTWLARQSGAAFTAGEYVLAVRQLQSMVRPVHRFLEEYDLILHPTLPEPPPRLGFLKTQGPFATIEKIMTRLPFTQPYRIEKALDEAAADAFRFIPWTPIFNVSGQPSMSVPLYWNGAGLPVGVMFSAKYGDEATLFRLAAQLEEARPWMDRRPVI